MTDGREHYFAERVGSADHACSVLVRSAEHTAYGRSAPPSSRELAADLQPPAAAAGSWYHHRGAPLDGVAKAVAFYGQ